MFKKLKLLLVLLIAFCTMLSAQSFFKPIPKLDQPVTTVKNGKGILFSAGVTKTDSTFNAVRPIMIAAAYSLPDNHIMSGIGLGYSNLTYNYATQRTTCNWSVNAVGFAGGSVIPRGQGDVMSYGIMLGALNNTIMAGACMNDKKLNFVASWAINFNN